MWNGSWNELIPQTAPARPGIASDGSTDGPALDKDAGQRTTSPVAARLFKVGTLALSGRCPTCTPSVSTSLAPHDLSPYVSTFVEDQADAATVEPVRSPRRPSRPRWQLDVDRRQLDDRCGPPHDRSLILAAFAQRSTSCSAFDASVLPRWHRAWHARGAARAHIARNQRDRALAALEGLLREDFLLSRLDVE